MLYRFIILCVLCIHFYSDLFSQENEKKVWTVEAGLSVSMFQQQIKAEIGDPSGQKLLDEYQIGILGMAQRKIWKPVSGGIFFIYDIGSRSMAQFAGFDSLGRTITTQEQGGKYMELWLGPVVRVTVSRLSLDIGYAIVGKRIDDNRTDIASSSGSTSGSFSVNPKVAWLFALGAVVPIQGNVDFMLKVEYRIRYYNQRDGNSLSGNIEHGTQSLAPFAGISIRL